MKPRAISVRTAVAVFVFIVAIILILWLLFLRGPAGKLSGNGEDQAQFTGSPGLPDQGEKLWGKPNRDLYPAIDEPIYLSADEADAFIAESDWVYLLPAGEMTFVFPEVLMASYHVVNDVIGGEPVAVTFCLLAGSSSLFSRRVDGRTLTFGLSGQLYCGNSVLYDRETETDWLQLSGEPIRGHFHGRARLQGRVLERAAWGRIRRRENLRVLAPIRGIEEYREFQYLIEREKLGQKVVESRSVLDPRLLPYTRGLGVRVQGETRFYPERPVHGKSVIQDRVGSWSIVILQDASGEDPRIFRRRHDGKVLDFATEADAFIDRQTGSRWSAAGTCIEGPLRGARLESPFYTTVYWFVWSALYPETGLAS